MAMDIRKLEVNMETLYADAYRISELLRDAMDTMKITAFPSEKRLFADSALREAIHAAKDLEADATELRGQIKA